MENAHPPFIRIKLISRAEKWVNPWNISTVTNSLSHVRLRMVDSEIVEFDYNEKENKQMLDYLNLWTPPKKEVL